MKAVIRHLRAAALSSKGDGPSDGQLLDYFLLQHDETAFEALVRRHGPMVFGVCQRLLRNVHDAEDAFQATFLVLARKAESVKPRQMVGNWLYGVAYRTAMKARTMNMKRRMKEKKAAEIPHPETSVDEGMLERLDHELNRLPDKYRVPVVLCELEGRSRKEVARMLGLPEGTLSWRLAHAKKLLGRRLSRYGAVAVSALLAESAASACLSPFLRAATTKTALTAGAVSANVLALTEGVMKTMLLSKLKITVCVGALMLAAGVGTTGLTYRAAAQQPQEGLALANGPQADELDALRLEIEALRKLLHATRERVKTLEDEVRTMKRAERNAPKKLQAIMPGMMPGGKGAMGRGGRSSTGQPGANTPPSQPGGPTGTSAPRGNPGTRALPPSSSDRLPGGISPGSPISDAPEAPPQQGTAPRPKRAAAPEPSPIQESFPLPRATERPPAQEIDSLPGAPEPIRPSEAQPPPGTAFPPPRSVGSSNPPEPEDHSLSHAEEALQRLRENPNDTKALDTLAKVLKQLKERDKR